MSQLLLLLPLNGCHLCSAMVFRHWVELEDGTVTLNPAPTADDDTLATSTFYSQVMSPDVSNK